MGAIGQRYGVSRPRLRVFDRPSVDTALIQREILGGDTVEILARAGDENAGNDEIWARIRAEKDGYEGWAECAHLSAYRITPTHRIAVPDAPVQPKGNVKYGPSPFSFFFGTAVQVTDWSDDGFWAHVQIDAKGQAGWVFYSHLRPVDDLWTDPVAVARLFLGAPYVWGCNTKHGLDCSGLVQTALLACGVPCPGDSGPQCDAFTEAGRDGPYTAGELLFWQGHVAMATGPDTMIHATAYSMSVIEEPIAPALSRIAAQGDTPWRGRGRPAYCSSV